jgi:hypothetical protein
MLSQELLSFKREMIAHRRKLELELQAGARTV